MTSEAQTIGRAKTVLVFGRSSNQKGVISAVVARRTNLPGKRRLQFSGTVKFSKSVMNHTRRTILPIIDRILAELELERKDFEISAVNIGVASSLDVGVNISGFSADTAVFLAMLSEALQMPLPDDFVSTGHIASVEGDISAVKAIPSKVEAARTDSGIRRFIYPDLEKDRSLSVLSPNERARSIDAIMAARDSIRVKAVGGLGMLIREVLAEESVVLASLKEGFFDLSRSQDNHSNPVSDVVSYLADNNEKRFWNISQRYLLAGECEKGKELLRAFARFFITRRTYPSAVGTRLFQLVCSLPPSVKRLKMDFPIMDTGLCIKLSQFAAEADHLDVLRLFDSAHGKNMVHKTEACLVSEPSGDDASDSDCLAFDTVVSQINEQTIAQEIGVPIDSARSSYILAASTVETYEQFIDTLQAFFIHLQRYIASTPAEAPDMNQARSETLVLLERAFYGRGGDQAAFARARDGIQGGMRSILDTLTEQYKAEKQAAYIQRIFKDAIAVMEWDQRVKFMRGAMKRLGSFLPPELKNMPPERFVGSYETIVRAYVESLDKVNQLLRTM